MPMKNKAGTKAKAKPSMRQRVGKKASSAAQCVVGIGASAGGYEAIRTLISGIPPESGLSFVVIQHLSPAYKSLTANLLAKYARMKVIEITDGMRIEPNHVYTQPSGRFVTIQGDVLKLGLPPKVHGRRLPIDHFFHSLGASRREGAIGIILSGTGADGTMGARMIAENGGLVLAQSPETAEFDEMPLSAIGTGVVNQVLAVRNMPEVLMAYARHPYVKDRGGKNARSAGADDTALRSVLAILRERRGFDFSDYKQGTLLRRIRRRMALRNIESVRAYCSLLKRTPDEIDALYRDLFIGVTEFFRDSRAWETLRDKVVVPLVARHEGRNPIRVWVTGCATGEEAYTLAILLHSELRAADKRVKVQMFATDVNEDALQFARAGIYPVSIAARVPPKLLRQYFVDARATGHYQVSPELRKTVIFSPHNVFRDPPFSRLDIVCCRNLLIYLEPWLQEKIIALFSFALRARGYLFLGSSETLGKSERFFETVSKKWRIYQSRISAPLAELLRPVNFARPGGGTALVGWHKRIDQKTELSGIARQAILDRHSPAAILIDGSFDALYFSGPTEEYLMRPHGAPTVDLLKIAREGLRPHLRELLRKAEKSQKTVMVDNIRMKRGNDFSTVKITLEPVGETGDGPLYLVVFEDTHRPAKTVTEKQLDSTIVRTLEAELRATKYDLNTSIDDLEIANRELSSANEEVLASNEELQSINEELESSKEELQSLNEELNVVNQQLQQKLVELERANTDLGDVVASSEIATIWLDNQLRIKWFTPTMSGRFHLEQSDTGRPVTDLASPLTDAGLVDDATAVMKKGSPVEHEQTLSDGRHFLRRILPFRNAAGELLGVIVTLFDITYTWRNASSALQARQQQAAWLEDEVRKRTEQLRNLLAALTDAEERERRNLAQNLHDDLAQELSIAQIRLAAAGRSRTLGEDAKKAIKDVDSILNRASRTVHSLAFQLSPSVLYGLGLIPAIEWLAEEMQRIYGLSVTVKNDCGGKSIADEHARTTIYRAVRELLINVAKHAKVDTAQVKCNCDNGLMTIEVSDSGSGSGFNSKTIDNEAGRAGFGLINVRERLEMIGGSFSVKSLPGDGTVVTIAVPLVSEIGIAAPGKGSVR